MSETLTPPEDPTPAPAPSPEAATSPQAAPPAEPVAEPVAPEQPVAPAPPVAPAQPPAVPPQPYAYPAGWQQPAPQPPYALPYPAAPQPAARRGLSPRVRIALRWTAMLLVFAVVGAGTAYAVTRPERTRIPGLKTPQDGRWTYPRLALPGLPPRKPRPLDTHLNKAGVHYADLRTLLLPEPEKAVNDSSFPGGKGWLPMTTYLKVRPVGDGSQQRLFLTENGLRHVAARAWTMPDGTRAEVYLLQFVTTAYADLVEQDAEAKPLAGVTTDKEEKELGPMVPHGIKVVGYSETAPYGDSMTRYALLTAGDTYAVVRLTRKGGAVPLQAFKQTVVLQAQMLG